MRIGCDIDGVLADFNATFIERVIAVTGRDLFPPRPFDIPLWNYPEYYGYTPTETSAVWATIVVDPQFWRSLGKYETTSPDLDALTQRVIRNNDDVYFITARPGIKAKHQTEMWISQRSVYGVNAWIPTVLISADKGACAKALQLDCYIDDRLENARDVYIGAPDCSVFVMDRPWNQGETNYTRVSSVTEMLQMPAPD